MNASPRAPRNQAELESIVTVIERAFADEPTTRAHRALVQSRAFEPESLPTIWDPAGQALATVQAVPCEIALLGRWVDGGIITMVATDPDARGRGYMRACMNAAHQWLMSTGRPLAILYGVPAIYPRFSYRPVMPRCHVTYPSPETEAAHTLREATASDIPAITALFNQQEINRPCSIKRSGDSWVWQSTSTSMAVLDGPDGIVGYARHTSADASVLDVIESAVSPGHEGELLDGLHGLAVQRGCERMQLRLMPDHPLIHEVNRRGTRLELSGVEMTVQPPQAGMLCVLDTTAVLNLLQPGIESRLRGHGLRLTVGSATQHQFGAGGPTVRIPHDADLAHLLAGYPGVPALRQWGALQGDDPGIALAQAAFPTAWPRWTVEPFWGE